jgi:hypothetical protein
MPHPCYTHAMPMLRPYPHHDGLSSASTPPNSQKTQILQLEKCAVAQFLIEETKNFSHKLKYKSNGKFTKLGKHVIQCSICRNEDITIESREKIVENSMMIEIELGVLNLLKKWKSQTGHNGTHSQAIQLLIDYYNFAKRELKERI